VAMVSLFFTAVPLTFGAALGVSARVVNVQSDGSYVGLECNNEQPLVLIDHSLGFTCG